MLKPLGKEGLNFLKKGNEVILPKKRAKKLSEEKNLQVNIMLFGPWSSGKTYSFVDLLLQNYKLFVFVTDMGSSGLSTIRNALKKLSKTELEENIVFIQVDTFEEVSDFLEDPVKFFPELYDFDPDFVIWEGFSNYQQTLLGEFVGGNSRVSDEKKDVPGVVEEGLQFEQNQWGQIRNGTMRKLAQFLSINNEKTGKIYHKIVTCQENYASRKKEGKNESTIVETRMPLIQGAALKLIGQAFDIIIRTSVEKTYDKIKYKYYLQGNENLYSKIRGFDLPEVMEASMGTVWSTIVENLGIVKDAKI